MVIAAMLVAAVAGCSQTKTSTAGGGTTASTGSSAGKTISVAFVTNNPSDYWTIARKGTEAAAKELPNVNVQFVMPDDGTAATQKNDVDQLLAKGVQGIAISPVDPANQTQMLNDAASKAVLLTQDSDAPLSNRVCYVGTDNHAAGLLAGKLMKEALPAGGKIMLFVGKRDAQNAKDREQGIRDALKGSNLQIIDVRTDDTDRAKAKANVADTLVKYPDIAGLMGLWSYNGPAILSAVQDAKNTKVKIVCFDEEDATLGGVKSGAIYATVVQQPYQIGYQAVKMLAQIIGGDKSAIPASKQDFIPVQAIKQADVDAFQQKLNQLRGR
jgi:ribose transport system substrate-binding protein